MTTLAPNEAPWAARGYRDEIDRELRRALAGRASPLYAMARYHLGWEEADGTPVPGSGGKGLRPILCLMACEAASGAHDRALPGAVAVELTHNFSLVHDDVQDRDRERRHRPTVWSVWGEAQAINAGTAMYALAAAALGRLAEVGVPPATQVLAHRMLHAACLELLEGQHLDLAFEARDAVSVSEYLDMIGGKTGALLGCSLALGALLADPSARGGEEEHGRRVTAFRAAGRDLGVAFQIRDDMLGVWGDARATGKPVGRDLAMRKKSLPVVDALQRASGTMRAALLELYAGSGDADPIDEAGQDVILCILDDLGVERRVRALAEDYRARAMARLDAVDLVPGAADELRAMARFLTERDH